jgi:sec-independent protein translocase protein TatB
MFDIAPSELLLVAVVALVVIGPKDLPRVMRFVGQWVSKARGVARHFRSGIDEMIRQAELEEMEKKWAAENERIMREHAAAQPPVIDGEMVPIGGQGEAPATDAPKAEPPAASEPQPAAPKPQPSSPLP